MKTVMEYMVGTPNLIYSVGTSAHDVPSTSSTFYPLGVCTELSIKAFAFSGGDGLSEEELMAKVPAEMAGTMSARLFDWRKYTEGELWEIMDEGNGEDLDMAGHLLPLWLSEKEPFLSKEPEPRVLFLVNAFVKNKYRSRHIFSTMLKLLLKYAQNILEYRTTRIFFKAAPQKAAGNGLSGIIEAFDATEEEKQKFIEFCHDLGAIDIKNPEGTNEDIYMYMSVPYNETEEGFS